MPQLPGDLHLGAAHLMEKPLTVHSRLRDCQGVILFKCDDKFISRSLKPNDNFTTIRKIE
jgi:hypothetical protein